jgi:hypothetical protein
MKPPIETIIAMAIILGRKIWRIPMSSVCGFFSGSAVEETGEGECALKRSKIAMAWRKWWSFDGFPSVASRTWGLHAHINPPFTPGFGFPNAVILTVAPKSALPSLRYQAAVVTRSLDISTSCLISAPQTAAASRRGSVKRGQGALGHSQASPSVVFRLVRDKLGGYEALLFGAKYDKARCDHRHLWSLEGPVSVRCSVECSVGPRRSARRNRPTYCCMRCNECQMFPVI